MLGVVVLTVMVLRLYNQMGHDDNTPPEYWVYDMSDELKEPSLWDVAKSVFSALLGVQSLKNYERDFKHGKAWQYIVIGLAGVGIFIFLLIMVVRFALSTAGV